MKAKEIKVGGLYKAKVSNKVVTVRVDAIRETVKGYGVGGVKEGKVYDVTNLSTGRKTTFRSAAKFREEVKSEPLGIGGLKGVKVGEIDLGDENRPDPTSVLTPTLTVAPVPNAKPIVSGLAAKIRKSIDDSPHLIIEARAGTGKTTTLIEGLKRLKGIPSTHPAALNPSPQQLAIWECLELSKGKANTVCFVAFNKSIASELQSRVPPGCEASTMHAMGFKAVRQAFGNQVKVEQYRVDDLICTIMGKDIWEIRKSQPTLIKMVKELVGLCKMNLTHLNGNTAEALDELCTHYDLDFEGLDRMEVYELVPKVLEACKDVHKDGRIDFDDMIWLPVILNLPIMRYDLLLVDEAQDLNRCQQALAKMAGRRLVLCGDPKQAIYGFAGADAESMLRMRDELSGQKITENTYRGCITLPLTVTRRCGKAIVKEANKIVADFDAHESNGEGSVLSASFDRKATNCYSKLAQNGDMVLCRVNAPLVSECFKFIKEGRTANIQGRDVGQGLINTIKKLMKGDENGSVVTLVEKLSNWLHEETKKENAKRFPSDSRIIALQDKHDCILCFTENVQTVTQVIAKVEEIFTDRKDTKNCILLSSVHKSKGLEAKRVFLLEPEGAGCPHPMASTAWQVEQEYNLRYVAITRAIEELCYVK